MDLDEFLFYEKKKNPDRDVVRELSTHLGVKRNTLYRVMHGKNPISSKNAFKIEKYTNNQVCGWDIIKKHLEYKEKQEKEKNNENRSD